MADTRLTNEEQEKITILKLAIAGKITNAHVGKQLRLSVRQVQRTKAKIRKVGLSGIAHGLKGKPGNHRISETTKEAALALIKEKYIDFRPTLATEKLSENHGITISYGTTRLWMIKEKLWKPRRQKQTTYRSWRPRKEYFGELEQFDGSYHHWFEDRYADEEGDPLEVCLLASIDDATGKITKAVFAANEGVHAVFTFWREYIEEHGKPLGIYLDKFSTYKINHKAAVDNTELMTQFQRAMQSLGVTLITAHSPEAKGRVERLFQTLQDRLVKEMRLANISRPEEGNRFLREVFVPKFNERFGVEPTKSGDIHRPLTQAEREGLSHILSIHETRRINLDFTVQFKNNWYQLAEVQPTTVRAREKVLVEVWLDNTMHLELRGHYLNFMILPERPKKERVNPIILTTHKLNYKPSPDHIWRRLKYGRG